MAQQNINFGSGPDDPNADTVRAAFAKIQNNFTELFRSSTLAGVTELIAGAGLTQDSTTGRVNVSANINQVRVLSTTLNVGINGSTGSQSGTLTRGSDTVWINIGPSITTDLIENAKFAVSASNQPNISNVGTLTALNVSGIANITNTTAATSPTSGAVLVAGGVGIAGNAHVGSRVSVTDAITTTSSGLNSIAKLYIDSPSTQTAKIAQFLVGGVEKVSITPAGAISASANISSPNLVASITVEAPTLKSTASTGTAPLVVLSNTTVANLNADLLDGWHAAQAVSANTIVVRNLNGSMIANVVIANAISAEAQANITSLGVITSPLSVSSVTTLSNTTAAVSTATGALIISGGVGVAGAVYAGSFNGPATGLTSIPAGQISGTVANAANAANVTGASQPTITSLGTLTGLTVSGVARFSNTSTATSTATGAVRVSGGIGVAGNVYAGAFYGPATGLTSIPGANVTGAVATAITSGTVTTAAQPNITSVGTLSSVTTSGQFTSTIAGARPASPGGTASGSAPAVVSSSRMVANLNAQFLADCALDVNATANTVVRRDLNGDIYASHIVGAVTAQGISVTDNSASNAMTITQLGTGNVLVVMDESSDTTPFVINNAGSVGIGISSPRNNSKLDVVGNVMLGETLMVSSNVAVSGASPVLLTSAATNTYRMAKHVVQVTQGTEYQAAEVLMIHDGTTVSMTEYAVIDTGTPLGDLSAQIVTGSMGLYFTLASPATAATVKVLTTYTLL